MARTFEWIASLRDTFAGKFLAVFMAGILALSMLNLSAYADDVTEELEEQENELVEEFVEEPSSGPVDPVVQNENIGDFVEAPSDSVTLGQAQVTFIFSAGAYAEIGASGQFLQASEGTAKLKVNDSSDLVFVGKADTDYEVSEVSASSNGSSVPISTDANGRSVISAENVSSNLVVEIIAVKTVETDDDAAATAFDEDDEGEEEDEEVVEGDETGYTVTFIVAGEEYDSVKVEEGGTVDAASIVNPTPPEGFNNFIGWNDESGNVFDFSTTVTSNITLYAEFSSKYIIQIRNYNGTIVHSWMVNPGDPIIYSNAAYNGGFDIASVVSSNTGEFLAYWYDESTWSEGDEGYPQQFTDGSAATKNITLKPYFSSQYLLMFVSEGSQVETQYIESGDVTEEPAAPIRNGYVFNGWVDEEGNPFTFGQALTADTVLKATWSPVDTTYTIVYWFEKPNIVGDAGNDTNNYEFYKMITKNAASGTDVSSFGISASSLDSISYGYYSHYTSTTNTVLGNGNTVVNVYFKRTVYTFSFDLNPGTNDDKNRNGATMVFGETTYGQGIDTDGNSYSGTQYSFTAKYEQDIENLWPSSWNATFSKATQTRTNNKKDWKSATYSNFIGWSTGSSTLVTKRFTLTSDLIPSSGTSKTFPASWGSTNSKTVNYWFEALPTETGGTSQTFSGSTRNYVKSDTHSQTVNLSGTLSAKSIEGVTYVSAKNVSSWGTVSEYNFYYTRDRVALSFDVPVDRITYDGTTLNLNSIMFGEELWRYEPTISTGTNGNYEYYYEDDTCYRKDINTGVIYKFEGWYYDADRMIPCDFSETMPNSNLYLFSKWAGTQFNITYFDDFGGNEIASEGKSYGDYADAGVAATEGYSIGSQHVQGELMGWQWYIGNGRYTTYSFEIPVTGDVDLYPIWKVTGFTINYVNADGATGSVPIDNNEYALGVETIILAGQDLVGANNSVFVGWIDQYSGKLYNVGNVIRVSGSTTLVAHYVDADKVGTIIYHKDGSGSINETVSQTIDLTDTSRESLLYASNTFVVPGWAFVGWNTKADNSGDTYSAGKWVALSELGFSQQTRSIDLFAMWVRTFTVTGVIDNEGSISVGGNEYADQTVNEGSPSKEMIFTPQVGYKVDEVLVNGEAVSFEEDLDENGNYIYNNEAIDKDIAVEVKTSARTDMPYTIEVYYQENGAYGAPVSYDETGTTGAEVSIEQDDYLEAGYAFDASQENILLDTIAGTGTTVLKVYYKQQFSVTYEPGNRGAFEPQSFDALDYNAATPSFVGEITGDAGYNFVAWDKEVAQTVNGDVTYTAIWKANENTEYTIEVYYQEKGAYDTPERHVSVGITDNGALVAPNQYIKDGYVFDMSQPNHLIDTINGDGSTVLKVYYKQQFSVTYAPGTHGSFVAQTTSALDYNTATPQAPEASGVAGYTFAGWDKEIAAVVTEDVIYTAIWTADTDTAYTIEVYYQEKGVYGAPETHIGAGETDTEASIGQNAYAKAGYVFDGTQDNVLAANIEGSGSTVLKVYYKQQFSVTYAAGEHGTFTNQTTSALDYNTATPQAPDTTGEAGYTFVSWSPQVAETVTEDVTYTAIWAADTDTSYTIEVYYQEDGGYSLPVTYTGAGETDTEASIAQDAYLLAGYAFDDTQDNVLAANIEGSGSTILKVYYKQQFNVTYAPGTHGSFAAQTTSALDYNTATPQAPEASGVAGYTFAGWDKEIAAVVTEDVVYVAQWTEDGEGTPPGTTPDETPSGPGTTDEEEAAPAPFIEALSEVLESAAEPVEQAFNPTETPLASGEWCWVHWYILLGMVITGVYSAIVIIRRRKDSKDLQDFEDDAMGMKNNPGTASGTSSQVQGV